jgi:hypothetical protein
VPGIRHLASPRQARIIRVTLSERAPLPMIQQITPSTRTTRKTSAASAGMPEPDKTGQEERRAASRPLPGLRTSGRSSRSHAQAARRLLAHTEL